MILLGLSLGIQTPTVSPHHSGGVFITGLSLGVQTPTVTPRHSGGVFLTGLSFGITIGDKPAGGFVQVTDLLTGTSQLTR